MTSARVAAMHARRELEFLAVCEGYEDRLTAAKQAVADAAEGAPKDAARAALKVAAQEMRNFREWARTVGKPKQGTPGRDATITMGGPVSNGVDN